MAEQEEVSGADASAHAPTDTGVQGTTSASSKEGGTDKANSEGAANEERTNVDGPDGPNGGARILFVGDLVGGIGRRTLLECLPLLRDRFAPTFVVVNGENVAGGLGITPKAAEQLFASGVDVITLGNHTYRRREIYPYLDSEPRIVRPANFLGIQPGHGVCVVESAHGERLGVVNLSGNLYLRAGRSAFTEIEVALGELEGVDQILVDMHAEATSEKVAMGWHLDGRVTAVVGTHTHVPTADARVLPGGTAYITDVGMTGPRGGVIGVKREQAIESLLTQMPVHFETSEDDPLMAVLIRCSTTPLRADSIEQVLMLRPE
jgi:metallophosphoesterase (TIGR00282 family)